MRGSSNAAVNVPRNATTVRFLRRVPNGSAIVSRQAETGDGTDLVDGLLRLDEFIEPTSIELPAGPNDTVGGLVVDQLGRIAEVGDAVEE